jgi:hypothetical protein
MAFLEGRADARKRNGKLEQALEDGNRMLSVDKTNPTVPPFVEYGVDKRGISV